MRMWPPNSRCSPGPRPSGSCSVNTWARMHSNFPWWCIRFPATAWWTRTSPSSSCPRPSTAECWASAVASRSCTTACPN
ncbi:hypothetical protein ACFFX0_27900 [Citricoccus parietis]|uniref:Uncharacterized protein n=1 Tax=Citricoccus parietis TaxID=592307 RepID=A0ABV5G769_9MICC